MINRFNFYDLYGYVVPGLSLLAVLWIPYAMLVPGTKPPDLAAALGLVVLAYVVGHIVQVISAKSLPSTTVDASGKPQYPSELLLHGANAGVALPTHMKAELTRKITDWFGQHAADPGEQAFFLCRTALLQRGKGGYAEQMQGMYTLMRGATTVLFLASAYFFGWWVSALPGSDLSIALSVAGLIALFGGSYLYHGRPVKDIGIHVAYMLGPILVLVGLGVALGSKMQANVVAAGPFQYFALLALPLAWLTWGSFRAFAIDFAKTVYRDFLVLEKRQEKEAEVRKSPEGEPEV
jgi:hypothetical protein